MEANGMANNVGMPMNIPNLFTLFRIALIPIIVIAFYFPIPGSDLLAAILFALGALTDWLDGFLARRLKQTSEFGAFLDPVADKLLVAVALLLIVSHHRFPFIAIPAAIIIGREITISALREWMAEIGKRKQVAVTWIAKLKTALQLIAITTLLAYQPEHGLLVGVIGYILLIIAALLTCWSMFLYLKAARDDLGAFSD